MTFPPVSYCTQVANTVDKWQEFLRTMSPPPPAPPPPTSRRSSIALLCSPTSDVRSPPSMRTTSPSHRTTRWCHKTSRRTCGQWPNTSHWAVTVDSISYTTVVSIVPFTSRQSDCLVKQEQWESWQAKRKLVSCGSQGYHIRKIFDIVYGKSCNL